LPLDEHQVRVPRGVWYVAVRFKHSWATFWTVPINLRVGQCVVVEADKAHLPVAIHCGYVESIWAAGTVVSELYSHDYEGPRHEKRTAGRLVRVAGELDLLALKMHKNEEDDILQYSIKLAKELEVPISLHSAECLMDGSKIIFRFTAPTTTYFVNLVKCLFLKYRCRIWLHQLDRETTNVKGATTSNPKDHDEEGGKILPGHSRRGRSIKAATGCLPGIHPSSSLIQVVWVSECSSTPFGAVPFFLFTFHTT